MRKLYIVNERKEVLELSCNPSNFTPLNLIDQRYKGFVDDKSISGFEEYDFSITDENNIRRLGVSSLSFEWGARILTIPIIMLNESHSQLNVQLARINKFFTKTMRIYHTDEELQTLYIDVYKPFEYDPYSIISGATYMKGVILNFKADNPYWNKTDLPTIESGYVTSDMNGYGETTTINGSSTNQYGHHFNSLIQGYWSNYVGAGRSEISINIETDNTIIPQVIIQGYCEKPSVTIENETGTYTFVINDIIEENEIVSIESIGGSIQVIKTNLSTGEKEDISDLYEGDVLQLAENNNIISNNFDSSLMLNYTPIFETVLVEGSNE